MSDTKTKVLVAMIWGGIVIAILGAINTPATQYKNEDHKRFCEIAIDREASNEYLLSNECPNVN